MMKRMTPPLADPILPKGIHQIRRLPDEELGALWDSIILDESLKVQLLSQAMLNFTLRGKVDRSVIPLHGVILLVGPPGTGKTSLARGLAHRTAKAFQGGAFRLLEIEPHALTSSAMGKTQRAVSDLFSQSIAEAADRRPHNRLARRSRDACRRPLEDEPGSQPRRYPPRYQRGAGSTRHARRKSPQFAVHRHQQLPAGGRQRVHLAVRSRHAIPLPDREACAQILKDCLRGWAGHSRRSGSSPHQRNSGRAPPNASVLMAERSARWSPTPSQVARRPP